MLPDLSLLLALVLGLYALAEPAGAAPDLLWSAGGTASVVLVVVALCRMGADRALKAIEEDEEASAVALARGLRMWPFLGWLGALFVFGWGSLAASAVPRAVLLVPHLLLFAPLAVMTAAGWAASARVLSHDDPDAAAPGAAFRRGVERNALVLLPFVVLTAVQELFYALDAWGVPGFRTLFLVHEAFPDVEVLLVVAMVACFAWLAPSAIRRVLKATPLPPGETRDRIERFCRSIGVRCRDFLLWRTGGRVANAMVVGLTARTRYVFVTDGLLAALPEPEVLAVVAHEAGHIRLRHLETYLGVTVAALLLMRSLEEALSPGLPGGADFLLSLSFLAFFWFGMLGWLSRRFERQADMFGADHAGALDPDAPPVDLPGAPGTLPHGAARMIAALLRIVAHQGMGSSHRHGSPAERVHFLASRARVPAVAEEQRASDRRLRRLLVAFGVAALASTAVRLPGGIARGEASLLFEHASEAAAAGQPYVARGDLAGARPHLERARALFLDAAARLNDRPSDLRMRMVAAAATYNAADLAIHGLGLDAQARQGFEAALGLLAPFQGGASAPIRFHARIDLGRLALRDASVPDPPARAGEWLAKAREVPEAEYAGPYRQARERLLESAIRLRDRDPTVAARARADLEGQTRPARPGEERWEELARDAAEELRLEPPRAGGAGG